MRKIFLTLSKIIFILAVLICSTSYSQLGDPFGGFEDFRGPTPDRYTPQPPMGDDIPSCIDTFFTHCEGPSINLPRITTIKDLTPEALFEFCLTNPGYRECIGIAPNVDPIDPSIEIAELDVDETFDVKSLSPIDACLFFDECNFETNNIESLGFQTYIKCLADDSCAIRYPEIGFLNSYPEDKTTIRDLFSTLPYYITEIITPYSGDETDNANKEDILETTLEQFSLSKLELDNCFYDGECNQILTPENISPFTESILSKIDDEFLNSYEKIFKTLETYDTSLDEINFSNCFVINSFNNESNIVDQLRTSATVSNFFDNNISASNLSVSLSETEKNIRSDYRSCSNKADSTKNSISTICTIPPEANRFLLDYFYGNLVQFYKQALNPQNETAQGSIPIIVNELAGNNPFISFPVDIPLSASETLNVKISCFPF